MCDYPSQCRQGGLLKRKRREANKYIFQGSGFHSRVMLRCFPEFQGIEPSFQIMHALSTDLGMYSLLCSSERDNRADGYNTNYKQFSVWRDACRSANVCGVEHLGEIWRGTVPSGMTRPLLLIATSMSCI